MASCGASSTASGRHRQRRQLLRGGIETEEQLDAALDGIREECTRLIGAGKKVIVSKGIAMDKDTRNAIDRATQKARRLLEDDFAAQLEGDFDVLASGAIGAKASKHLRPRQVFARDKVIAAIEHKRASGLDAAAAVADYLRDAAFTTLNRFAR
jgi:hypothetical protein